jgi:murein L,D-transpeptidase YafK
MSKATIEYDLSAADDVMAMKQSMKSSDMAIFIWELKHNFWRKWKHDDSEFNLETYKEALNELLDEYNINPDELIS